MKNPTRTAFFRLAVLAGCIVLTACSTPTRRESRALYDLGPLPAQPVAAPAAALPAISIAEVQAPAWLETPAMYFRLGYADRHQPQPYANSRWTMPPAQLFGQRLKARVAQAGGVVLAASDGATNVPVLRVEAEEFIHSFDSPEQSSGRITVRASVFTGRTWVAQRTFSRQVRAPSADATGGADALAAASDAVIADMMSWLAGLPLKK